MKRMEIVYLSPDALVPYDNNPRMNEGGVEPVAKSIEQYGFKVPIVIDKDNVVVCGHTRLKAAQKLGLEEVPCIMADDLTDDQVKAFRIADNKVSDFSMWDNKKLLQELEDLNAEDLFTGFDLSNFSDLEIMDEKDNSVIENNEDGLMYEVVFRSAKKEKIDSIKLIWDGMDDE